MFSIYSNENTKDVILTKVINKLNNKCIEYVSILYVRCVMKRNAVHYIRK